jgi:hypothetical protein
MGRSQQARAWRVRIGGKIVAKTGAQEVAIV